MLKFLWYLFIFYFVFYLIKFFLRLYKNSKQKSSRIVKPPVEIRKKSEIDKDKVVDAHYEEL
jgi:heme/copper-type cytochrome/quinol oxidase subunit 2